MSVTYTQHDAVALIHMDDGKANAVSHDLLGALHTALDRAEAAAKAVVLAGRPGRFSAGFDLNVMRGASADEVQGLVKAGGEAALRLYSFPLPVVAACTGHAIAMGCFLLLSCDTRIGVAGDFKIGANETAIGMVLPPFGLELAKARLAPTRFTRAIVQAKLFDPKAAVDAGYLDQTAEPEALIETALAEAARLGELPGGAYKGNKLAMRQATIEAIRATL